MKNPLCFASISLIVAAFCSVLFSFTTSLFIFSGVLLLLVGAVVYGYFIKSKNTIVTCFVCIIFVIFGALYSYIYMLHADSYTQQHIGNNVEVKGKIVESDDALVVQLDEINNRKVYHKMRFYLSYFGDESFTVGDKVTVSGKLFEYQKPSFYGDLDYRLFCKAKYIYGNIKYCEITKTGQVNDVYKLSHIMRTSIINNVDTSYEKEEAGLLKAILIGDKSDISPDLKKSLAYSGLSHIAVVSGAHISILLSLIGSWLGFLKKNNKIYVFITVIIIGILLCLIGGQPSVLRAVIMAIYSLIALSFYKRYDMLTALMFSGAVLVVINPYFAADPGFLLSFFATFALIVGNKTKFTLYGLALLFITLMPLCFYYFNYISFAMFFTSVAISPIVTLLLPLGFIVQVVPFLRFVVDFLLKITIIISNAFAHFDFFRISIPVPSIVLMVALCLVVATVYFAVLRYKKVTALLVALAISFAVADCIFYKHEGTEVVVFDDYSTVLHIKTKNKKDIIICTDQYKSAENYILKYNLKNIDVLYFTKFQDTIETDNEQLKISKVCVPKVVGQKVDTDFPVKYYDKDSITIDGVVLTPKSYMPYRSKSDHKKAVTTVNVDGKTFLIAPYKDSEMNTEKLGDIKADVVVYDSGNISDGSFLHNINAKFVTGNSLQENNNMLYSTYNTDMCGSVTFSINAGSITAKTLR